MIDSPVTLTLILEEAPSEPQLRLLSLASPFTPVIITARIDTCCWNGKGFSAVIDTIESPPPKPSAPNKRKMRQNLAVRKRGACMLPE
jgi:hypothetical protein